MEEIEHKDIERDGVKYRVALYPDGDANPRDYECYGDADIARFDHGDWQYVGVVVQPVMAGFDADDLGDSLWAVEYGENSAWVSDANPRGIIGIDWIVSVYVPDMISEVRHKLSELLGALLKAGIEPARPG